MNQLLLLINASPGAAIAAIGAIHDGLEILADIGGTAIGVVNALFGVVTSVVSTVLSGLKSVSDFVIGTLSDAISSSATLWRDFEQEAAIAFGNIANEAGASMQEVKNLILSTSTALGKDLLDTARSMKEVLSGGFRDAA